MAAATQQERWAAAQKKEKAPRAPGKKSTTSAPDLRRFELVRDEGYMFLHYGKATSHKEAVKRAAVDIRSAINGALHRMGITNDRVEEFRVAQSG